MTYRRQRRTQAAYQQPDDNDRVYTEDDYAVKEEPAEDWVFDPEADAADVAYEDEAFLPDEGAEDYDDHDGAFDPFNVQPAVNYADPFDTNDLLDLDADPLSEDLLTEEEMAALRRSHWKVMAGLGDFLGVIVGTAVILVLVALLVSLVNWLLADMNTTFTLWQTRM